MHLWAIHHSIIMKNLLFIIFILLLTGTLSAQSLSVGDKVSAFELRDLSTEKTISLNELEGKIILIDFWATWCAPCITGMHHLEELQKEFPEDLKVLAVSYEDPDRIQRFTSNKTFGFTFAEDKEKVLRELFPYRIISHTVLMDKNGQVRAITSPDNINRASIEKIISGNLINLPLKADNISFNPTADYFNAPKGLEEKFEIQPYNPDLPSFSKSITAGEYAGRRINLHNFTVPGLYRHAFNKSSMRLVLDIDPNLVSYEPHNLYNLDIIVAQDKKCSLNQILAEKLLSSFSIQAKKEIREQEVGVIYSLDSLVTLLNKSSEKSEYEARGDYFSGIGVDLDTFADYLESFGVVDIPVVNETALEGLYNINFSFDPEDPDTFYKALGQLGLGIKRSTRPIEVLVLFEPINDPGK